MTKPSSILLSFAISGLIILPTAKLSAQAPRFDVTPSLEYTSPISGSGQIRLCADFSAETFQRLNLDGSLSAINRDLRTIAPTASSHRLPDLAPSPIRNNWKVGAGMLLMGIARQIIFPDYPTYKTDPSPTDNFHQSDKFDR